MRIDIATLDAVLFSIYWTNIQAIKEHLAKSKNAAFRFTNNINIEPLLNLQYAYNPNPQRAIFFPITRGCTIMFPNLQDGWASLFHNIANGLNSKACYMRIMDDTIVETSNYLIHIENMQRRVVYTLKENKWIFFEQGTPLFFENQEHYNINPKKKRLNKTIMLEYSERLEITQNGIININTDGAFACELFWEGQFANSKGAGAVAFTRK